jgi:hypothetical protein
MFLVMFSVDITRAYVLGTCRSIRRAKSMAMGLAARHNKSSSMVLSHSFVPVADFMMVTLPTSTSNPQGG